MVLTPSPGQSAAAWPATEVAYPNAAPAARRHLGPRGAAEAVVALAAVAANVVAFAGNRPTLLLIGADVAILVYCVVLLAGWWRKPMGWQPLCAALLAAVALVSPATLLALPEPPGVTIGVPEGTIRCLNPGTEKYCEFQVRGASRGVGLASDLRIHLFARSMRANGWYLQWAPPAVRSDGTWTAVAQVGGRNTPVRGGERYELMALVVDKDATCDIAGVCRGRQIGTGLLSVAFASSQSLTGVRAVTVSETLTVRER